MDRRYGIVTKLVRKDRALSPDAKSTPAISRASSHRMPLLLVLLDECQEYGIVDVFGPRIIKALQTLAKVAPGAGIMLMIGTQKPDADSLPSGLRDQCVSRAALHVPAWQVSDVILGAGARRDGADASTIPASHVGGAIFKGAGDESSIDHAGVKVRSHYIDLVDLAVIIDRARELRIAAGTLSGMAASEDLIVEAPGPHLVRGRWVEEREDPAARAGNEAGAPVQRDARQTKASQRSRPDQQFSLLRRLASHQEGEDAMTWAVEIATRMPGLTGILF